MELKRKGDWCPWQDQIPLGSLLENNEVPDERGRWTQLKPWKAGPARQRHRGGHPRAILWGSWPGMQRGEVLAGGPQHDRGIPEAWLSQGFVKPADGDHPDGKTIMKIWSKASTGHGEGWGVKHSPVLQKRKEEQRIRGAAKKKTVCRRQRTDSHNQITTIYG